MIDLFGHVPNADRITLPIEEALSIRPPEGFKVIYADPPRNQ